MCSHSSPRVCAAMLLCLYPISVLAQGVYRCPQPGGGVLFQQFACEQGEVIQVEPAVSGWIGLRAEERAGLEATRKPASSASAGRQQGSQTDWQSGDDGKDCRKRRDRLDKTQARLRRGYKASEGERLRRQRDEDRAWLRRFC